MLSPKIKHLYRVEFASSTISFSNFYKVVRESTRYASVPLYLNNTKVEAIIDTGSNISFISEELVLKCNLNLRRFNKSYDIQGLGDSGTSIIGECVSLQITISGATTYFTSLRVIDSLQIPMLLGMDWLVSAQIAIDLKKIVLKEHLNNQETKLLRVGQKCIPTTNLFLEPLPTKPIYLGPEEAANITLQFPGNTKYFRRDKRSKIRYRLLSEPKKGRAKFSAMNSYGLTKIYLETMGKAEEDICLGGSSGIYSRFGIRGYTSIEEHLKDKDYGPDLTRILPAFVYYPPKFPAEIVESRQFKEERKRNVVKILRRENNDLSSSDVGRKI